MSRSRRSERKDRQLCRQVQDAISLALAAECDDDLLGSLWVVDVSPAPDASRLMVTVEVPRACDIPETQARLSGFVGFLRSEIAQGTHRKRVPSLAFRVIPRGSLSNPIPSDERTVPSG